MKILILTTSASDESVGRSCTTDLERALQSHGVETTTRHLVDMPAVWVRAGGIGVYPEPYQELDALTRECGGVILVAPVYCYTASSPTKTLSESLGSALEHKPVGFLVTAGSIRSHLAFSDLAASMMFEQSSFIYPKMVMATAQDLEDGSPNKGMRERIAELSNGFTAFARAIRTMALQGTTV